MSQDRQDLEPIVQTTFPLLQQIFASCLEMNSLEAAQMMVYILKIWWSSFQLVIPQYLKDPAVLGPWIEMFRRLLAKRLPEASEGVEPLGQPVAVEERNRWPWWKAKKWILQIFVRFFQRWAHRMDLSENEKGTRRLAEFSSVPCPSSSQIACHANSFCSKMWCQLLISGAISSSVQFWRL